MNSNDEKILICLNKHFLLSFASFVFWFWHKRFLPL